MTKDEILRAIGNGQIIVDIGQVDAITKRALRRMVARGWIATWRGYWYPWGGDPSGGLGPLKQCYALWNPYDLASPRLAASGEPSSKSQESSAPDLQSCAGKPPCE